MPSSQGAQEEKKESYIKEKKLIIGNANMIETIGLIAAIVLPLWNLPLIHKIRKRRSSMDISLHWAVGVWVCLVLMLPSAILSKDVVFKTFSIVNSLLFTVVMIEVVRFRKSRS